jgi:hypothetical protein
VPEPNASEAEVVIRKLKRYNSPGSDKIQAGGWGILHYEIHILIMLIWNKEELPPVERVNCHTYSRKGR